MFESVFFSQWKGKDYYLLLIPLIPVIIHLLIIPVQEWLYIKFNQFDIYAFYYYESQNFIDGKTQ